MFRWINLWLGKGLEKVVLGFGAAAAFAAILWRSFTKGEQRERERQEARRLQEMQKEIQERLDADRKMRERLEESDHLSDDDIARRLRDKWTRNQDH